MRHANLLLERFLPEVVDTLRQATAVARAAEEELAKGTSGDSLELLLDQQVALQSALTLLRVMHTAREITL